MSVIQQRNDIKLMKLIKRNYIKLMKLIIEVRIGNGK